MIILSPSAGYRGTARTVRVRVRLRRVSGHFRATVGDVDVSRRFGPVHAGVRTAVLRRGRDFRRGRNRLLVTAGSGVGLHAAERDFVAQRRDPRLLTIATPTRSGTQQPYRVPITLRRGVTSLIVRLNGHRASVTARDRQAGTHRLAVGAGDGLQAGANLLTVRTSRDRDATTDVAQRRFRLSPSTIVPAAGRDRVTQPGRAIALDADGSRAGVRGGLLYRWRVVRRPRGSRARVVNPSSAHAKLMPDLPGRYRVRLVMARAPRGARGAVVPQPSPPAPTAPPKPTCLSDLVGPKWHASTATAASPSASASPSATTPIETLTTPTTSTSSTTTPIETLTKPVTTTTSSTTTSSTTTSSTTTSSTTTSSTTTTTPPVSLVPAGTANPPGCIVPTGTPTPPVPASAAPTAAADDVEIEALATQAPLGKPIETMAADGSIEIGSAADADLQRYPASAGAWAHVLVLDQRGLTPINDNTKNGWGAGDQTIGVNALPSLAATVAATDGQEIVVITGMGVSHTASQIDGAAAEASLAKAVATLGGDMPASPSARQAMILSGDWSIVGRAGSPGSTTGNLDGFTESPPTGAAAGSLPGSLDGYLQVVTSQAFDYVSPEYVPIDTMASGSTSQLSVFQIGTQRFASQPIAPGALALHILILATGTPNGQLTKLEDGTFMLNVPPNNATYPGGAEGAASFLQKWRNSSQPVLIVMQSFGAPPTPATAPTGSAAWVSDDLGLGNGGINDGMRGQSDWNGQPLIGGGAAQQPAALDQMWNPGYPTVAGQVGDLTGVVGHDDIADFGVQDRATAALNSPLTTPTYLVREVTMVAPNHPYDTAQSYVNASGDPSAPARVVGTLTRDRQSNWQIDDGAAAPEFGGSSIWQLAFGTTEPWPCTSPGPCPVAPFDKTHQYTQVTAAEALQYQKADAYIASQLWPGEGITDVRPQYVAKANIGGGWALFANTRLQQIQDPTAMGFTASEFANLKGQLATEMNDVDTIQGANGIIGLWQQTYGKVGLSAIVNLTSLAQQVTTTIKLDQARRKAEITHPVDPIKILGQAMDIAGTVAGFSSITSSEIKLAQTLGALSKSLGLIDSLTPHSDPGTGRTPDTNDVWTTADDLAVALTTRFQTSSAALSHLGDIFDSDWGKLQQASADATGPWAFSNTFANAQTQAVAVSTEQSMYQALLPLNYTQWLISPYQTPFNGGGPPQSGHQGNGYQCGYYNSDGKVRTKRPFVSEPYGGTSITDYRAAVDPGATAAPQGPNTVPYLIRALKSDTDPLRLRTQQWDDRGNKSVTIDQDGSSPPASLIDKVLAPVNPDDSDPASPTNLGMSKVPFYADFGAGPSQWRKMICAHTLG